MSRVSISLKSAKDLLEVVKTNPWGNKPQAELRAQAELHSAIQRAERPRPGLKKAKAVREKKKRTKSKDTKSIRAQVMERANGICECGCGAPFGMTSLAEMDHFFPKGRTPQTVATCWALRPDCHRFKTKNSPSAAYWLQKFVTHAEKHGYHEEFRTAARRLRSLELQVEAVGT